jgi:hypothetical protein
MSEENPTIVLGIAVGLMCVIGGMASLIVYQRQSEIWINLLLIIPGIVCIVGGYYALSRRSRARVNNFFVKLGITKEKLVVCVDCRSYVGQYEVSTANVNGRLVIHQEPRFSEGICMEMGRLIHDGFSRRKCIYFQRRRIQSLK